jgi:urease accessory protein
VTQLLRLLHLASPALPIGGFHFSQGLEYAVTRGWVNDESSASEWIAGLAESVLGRLDLPTLLRLFDAVSTDDRASLQRWNALLIASRETAELRAEDLHMGSALAKVLIEHELDFASTEVAKPTYAAVFAFACQRWNVARSDALSTYAWAWSENQTLAAVKLVPLGQSAGQRIVHRLASAIPSIVRSALAFQDDDIGVGALMQGVSSALHETQYTRLFRS